MKRNWKASQKCATNQIANGPPTGVALVNTVTFEVIDSVSFGGTVTVKPTGFPASFSFFEGTKPSTVVDTKANAGSCIRLPDGKDSNSEADDWVFSTVPA